jgi:hypothetical protein
MLKFSLNGCDSKFGASQNKYRTQRDEFSDIKNMHVLTVQHLVLEIFTFCALACVVPCLLSHSASADFASPTHISLQNFSVIGILSTNANAILILILYYTILYYTILLYSAWNMSSVKIVIL